MFFCSQSRVAGLITLLVLFLPTNTGRLNPNKSKLSRLDTGQLRTHVKDSGDPAVFRHKFPPGLLSLPSTEEVREAALKSGNPRAKNHPRPPSTCKVPAPRAPGQVRITSSDRRSALPYLCAGESSKPTST